MLLCTPAAAINEWQSRPGTVAHTLSLADDTQVTLDGMVVVKQVDFYIFVKDPWSGSNHLPVYVGTRQVEQWSSVEITGVTDTISGQRIVIASQLRQYLTPNGMPFIMMPKGMDEPYEWECMQVISGTSAKRIPPPPAEQQDSFIQDMLLPEDFTPGTIPWAKNQADQTQVTLEGKVVSAVFYKYIQPNTVVDYFYVEEPGAAARYAGIRVVPMGSCLIHDTAIPPNLVILRTRFVVTITGTLTTHDGEACIDASEVVVAPAPADLFAPAAMNQYATTGAAFGAAGLQPATVRDTTTVPVTPGKGFAPVGCRVRLFGTVSWISGDRCSCSIDDGSGLRSTIDDGGTPMAIQGIRVRFATGCPPEYEEGQHVIIAGILGCELSDGCYVPVLRVPTNVIHVKRDGNDEFDGLSWSAAKATIRVGIDTAYGMTPKGEVWVQENPSIGYADQYAENIVLKDGVAVYGGFQGNEAIRESRSWQTNETIIGCGLAGLPGARVTATPDLGPDTRLDGFTIMGGWPNGMPYPYRDPGGGIYCNGSYVTITNNLVTLNAREDMGAGICCIGGAPTIINNEVFGNWTYDTDEEPDLGSGIYCANSAAVISGNFIRCNRPEGTATTVMHGGGTYCTGGAPQIIGNTILRNDASVSGGGIFCTGGAPLIARNTVEHNTAPSGGGIYCDSLNAQIVSNVIRENISELGSGGGIYVACGSPIGLPCIVNNTLRDNNALVGGAVYIAGIRPLFANNIVAFNSSGVWYVSGAETYINYNNAFDNVAYNYAPWDLTGPERHNISVYPGFLADGFHIPSVSWCTGVGDPSIIQPPWQEDIDREQRIQPPGSAVDIGADETANHEWQLELDADYKYRAVGQSLNLTATLTDRYAAAVPDQTVQFSVTEGNADLEPPEARVTNANGIATIALTSDTAGWVTIAATVNEASGPVQSTMKVFFDDESTRLVDIFFCLDCTGSMRTDGDHSALPSVTSFLNSMSNDHGIESRVGCVRFNEMEPDYILEREKRSLGQFSTLPTFLGWMNSRYLPAGGDDFELQLDALHYGAEDMRIHAVSPCRYIVLITDGTFHDGDGGTVLTKSHVISDLQHPEGPQCGVFLSLWEWPDLGWLYDPYDELSYYYGLPMNQGVVDAPNYAGNDTPGNWRYPLNQLRARILLDIAQN